MRFRQAVIFWGGKLELVDLCSEQGINNSCEYVVYVWSPMGAVLTNVLFDMPTSKYVIDNHIFALGT